MEDSNTPWETIKSQIVYQNPWMKTYEDQVRMPNGDKGIYGFIDSKPGVFIIALTEHNEIYLIESFRYPTQKWQWELPTGGIDEDMSPLEAAKHELAEELGMTAKKWTHINAFGPSSNGFMKDIQNVFLAEGLSVGERRLESFEAIRGTKAVAPSEVIRMINDGILVDGQSLAALMAYLASRGTTQANE